MNKYDTFKHLNSVKNRDFIRTCNPLEVEIVTALEQYKDHRVAADNMGVSRTLFVKTLDRMAGRVQEWRKIRRERMIRKHRTYLKIPSERIIKIGRRIISRVIYELPARSEFTAKELADMIPHPLIRKMYVKQAIYLAKTNGRITSTKGKRMLVNSRWVAVYVRTDTPPPRGFT